VERKIGYNAHMTISAFGNWTLLLLRLSLGWMMLYAGVTKLFDPGWSAAGYLAHAQTFPAFFAWFARPEVLPFTNALNEWGITLVGISLLLGAATRAGAFFGILLMLLYYFPALAFPYPNAYSFIVDDHLIYAAAFALLMALRAGTFFGLDAFLSRASFVQRSRVLKFIFG